MDREPLAWNVRRHVVDVTFRELDLPRTRRRHRRARMAQAHPEERSDRVLDDDAFDERQGPVAEGRGRRTPSSTSSGQLNRTRGSMTL